MKWLLAVVCTAVFGGFRGAEAEAQDAQEIIGARAQVGNVNIAADGSKTEEFGPNPKGQALFDSNCRYTIFLLIRSVSADELTFGNEGGSQGGTNEVTFKRLK